MTSALERFIAHRKNISTPLDTQRISNALPGNVRAHMFFSARVAEDHIIEKLRKISDSVTRGEMNVAQGRQALKDFLLSNGHEVELDDGTGDKNPLKSIKNLGSTARLNLILEQNRLMANSVATYAEGMDPDVMEQWPYWRYRCIHDDRTRDAHAELDGKVFKKTDPIWNTIFPPNGFNCRCWVEDVSEEEAQGKVSAPPQFQGVISGIKSDVYQFNPRDAFASYDLTTIKNKRIRAQCREKLKDGETIAKNFGIRIFPERIDKKGRMQYITAKELGLKNISHDNAINLTFIKNNKEVDKIKKGNKITVTAPDGSEVIFDNNLVKHLKKAKGHDKNDFPIRRLEYFNTAMHGVKNASERWDTESGRTYICPVINNGKKEFIKIVVGNNNQVETFHVFNQHKINTQDRKGISHEKF